MNENIESALILEDDLDWDVNIHDILYHVAYQMRTSGLRNTVLTELEESSAPYGTFFS